MIGSWRLGLRHLRFHPGRSVVLALCVACAVALPVGVRTTTDLFRVELLARAEATPMIVGAKGSPFDLAMSLLYFRRAAAPTMTMGDASDLVQARAGTVIPVHQRFTARGRPVVATTPEYLALRGLRCAEGTPPLMIGDATLGATVARDLQMGVGGHVFSDQVEVFDLSKPQALKMRVVGVLRPTGTPEDGAIIVDLKTAWILEGLSHAHSQGSEVPAGLVDRREEGRVTYSESMVDFNEVTPENAGSFHLHVDERMLPVSGVIVVPASAKDGTILSSRLNAGTRLQAVSPVWVVRDLLAYVVRIGAVLAAVSWLVAGMTAALLGLVVVLSVRVRAGELATYRRIGVSSWRIGWVVASEWVVLVGVGAVLGWVLGLAVGWGVSASGWLVKMV
jgi:putative ABC transport system permease protein